MSDINEKVVLTVEVEGGVAKVSRSPKGKFMLDADYDMSTMFGVSMMLQYFSKILASENQKPEQIVDSIAEYTKRMMAQNV